MRLVLMGGSLRKDSLNARLLGHLAGLLRDRGHEVRAFAGGDLRWPLYEDGLATPPDVLAVHQVLREAQGAVIISPEYNAGIPGHLKNAVDWLSVQRPSPWKGLPVLLGAASPGAFGGARGLISWRATLANMGALVVPDALTVPHADQQLDPAGSPTDPRTAATLDRLAGEFLDLAERLRG